MRSFPLLALLLLPLCARGQEAPPEVNDRYAHARQQLALGNTGLAIEGFRKLLRQNPRSLAALNGLAVAYDRLQRFDISRGYYEHALGLNPAEPVTLNNFAASLLLQGRPDEARPLLEKAATASDAALRAQAKANLAWLHAAPKIHSQIAPENPPENKPEPRIIRLGPSTKVLRASFSTMPERR